MMRLPRHFRHIYTVPPPRPARTLPELQGDVQNLRRELDILTGVQGALIPAHIFACSALITAAAMDSLPLGVLAGASGATTYAVGMWLAMRRGSGGSDC